MLVSNYNEDYLRIQENDYLTTSEEQHNENMIKLNTKMRKLMKLTKDPKLFMPEGD